MLEKAYLKKVGSDTEKTGQKTIIFTVSLFVSLTIIFFFHKMFILKELPLSLYSNVSPSTHCTFCHSAFKISIASFGYDSLPFPQI